VNLLSPRQAMNASFEPFNLVNTYGAFGSVSRERYEVIIEGTRESRIGEQTKWLEYELPCKPGRVDRRPCWVTPYHYRLEWQLGVVHGRSDRKLHRLVKPSMQSSMQQARTVAPNRPIRRSRAPQLLTISTFRTVEQSPSLAFGAVEASEPSNRSPGSREMPWRILGLGRFDSRPR
jgi:hypothetical protein